MFYFMGIARVISLLLNDATIHHGPLVLSEEYLGECLGYWRYSGLRRLGKGEALQWCTELTRWTSSLGFL